MIIGAMGITETGVDVEIIGSVGMVRVSAEAVWMVGASNGAIWIVGTNEGGRRRPQFIDGVGLIGSTKFSSDIDSLRQPLVRSRANGNKSLSNRTW